MAGMGAVSNLLHWGFGRMTRRVDPEEEGAEPVDDPTDLNSRRSNKKKSKLGDYMRILANSHARDSAK